jgi:hypothetical protein
VTRLPSETNGAGLLRDTFGRRELTVRNLNDPLDIGDVPGVGTVFDADGREQVVITGRGGTVLSVDGDAAIVDAYKLGVRASNAGATNRDLIANAVAAIPAGIPARVVLPGDLIPLAPLTLPERARTIAGRDTGVGGVLAGSGSNGTVLRLPDGSNADLLTLAGTFWTVRDLGLDGNRENNTAGSCLRISKPRAMVHHVHIGWAAEHGIVNEGASGSDQAHAPLITGVYVRSCAGIGVYVKGANAPDMQAAQVWVGACGSHGIKTESTAGLWDNIHVWGNGGDGFQAAARTVIGDIYSETNTGHGVRFTVGANGSTLSDFFIWANGQHGIFLENVATPADITVGDGELLNMVGYGVVGQNSSYVLVHHIKSRDTQATKTQGYAIQTNGTSDFWTITDNKMLASDHRLTSHSLVGTSNNLRGNRVAALDTSGAYTPAAPTVGASPYVYQNLSGSRQEVYVSGGTVTALDRSRTGAFAGEQVTVGAVAGQITLDNRDYLRIAYTVVPTVRVFTERP